MKPNVQYTPVIASEDMETNSASIEMTAEMFDMLSSKVYTDKVLAVVREITCNAKDAQVELGEPVPLDIHLPTRLESYFSVRDYGTGLSHNDVMELYLSYGKSTKTTSNDLIGGLGIGSKSPLAYASSFVVISRFNGQKRSYNIHKSEGIPQVTLLDTESCALEDTGLEVKVSVKDQDRREFEEKTHSFLDFFDYPCNVNGEEYKSFLKKQITDDSFFTYNHTGWGSNLLKVRMGGVVYNVCDQELKLLRKQVPTLKNGNTTLVLEFNIGDLTVAASREALSEDKQTIEKIKFAIEDIKGTILEVVQQNLNNMNKQDAYRYIIDHELVKWGWCTVYRKHRYTDKYEGLNYKGTPLTNFAELSDTTCSIYRNYCNSLSSIRFVDVKISDKNFFIIRDKTRSHMKLSKYLESTYDGAKVYFIKNSREAYKIFTSYFGKDIKIQKLSKLLEEYKDALKPKKVKRPKSTGIYKICNSEVNDLNSIGSGYYIITENGYVTINGSTLSRSELQRDISNIYNNLHLDLPDIYFVNKTSTKYVKGLNLVEFNGDVFKDTLKGKFRLSPSDTLIVAQVAGCYGHYLKDFLSDWTYDGTSPRYDALKNLILSDTKLAREAILNNKDTSLFYLGSTIEKYEGQCNGFMDILIDFLHELNPTLGDSCSQQRDIIFNEILEYERTIQFIEKMWYSGMRHELTNMDSGVNKYLEYLCNEKGVIV